MKHPWILALLAMSVASVALAAEKPVQLVTINYGSITLPSTLVDSWLPGQWDLNAGAVTVSYTVDLKGAPNVDYDWNWNNAANVGLFSPISGTNGARMSGFLADWENRTSQFPTYPDNNAAQDMDDKFNLQRFPNPGAYDESMYDVDCINNLVVAQPPNPGLNYGIWFDRDGVDQWQAQMWGMVNGGTYNTGGVYPVRLTFRRASATAGTACPVFSPALPNGYDPYLYGIETGFYTSWRNGAPQFFPAGISFETDESLMEAMQVRVTGSSGPGKIIVQNLVVTGFLDAESGKDVCKDGGWQTFSNPTFRNQGQCVSYFISNRR